MADIPKGTYYEEPNYKMQHDYSEKSPNYAYNYREDKGEENAVSSEDGFTENSFDSI